MCYANQNPAHKYTHNYITCYPLSRGMFVLNGILEYNVGVVRWPNPHIVNGTANHRHATTSMVVVGWMHKRKQQKALFRSAKHSDDKWCTVKILFYNICVMRFLRSQFETYSNKKRCSLAFSAVHDDGMCKFNISFPSYPLQWIFYEGITLFKTFGIFGI